ncbi:MAG: NAD(P)-binding protein [Sandaracinaceae bacterium]|nr:NAD(P)-binding protein [Sandaracinaceae bacterium]
MSTQLPPYVERPTGYDLALAGPYHQRGVTLRAFALEGDPAALQATCDRYLNRPGSPWIYRPLGRTVLLTMLNMEHVSAGDPSLGYMHEIDGAFQMPVLRYAPGAKLPSGVATFMPYLWVNNDWPMITGREVLAFRKEIGTSFSDGDDTKVTHARALTHVDAWVIPARDSELVNRRVFEIRSGKSERGAPWATPTELLRGVAQGLVKDAALFAEEEIAHLLPETLEGGGLRVPTVFLKQLRDAYDNSRAVVQEVFVADGVLPLSGLRGAWPLIGEHHVWLADFASHPIAQELGLGNGGGQGAQTLDVKFAFEVDFDFDMELPKGKQRVAILGGGPSALAAALDLAAHPDRFEISVHTMGWRLGGKCASARDGAAWERNLEHGLHLPMGFYENFFDQIRAAYELLARPPGTPLATWQEAFIGRTTLVLQEKMRDGWHDWPFHFGERDGIPGDRARALMGEPGWAFDWRDVITALFGYLERVVHEILAGHPLLDQLAEHLAVKPFEAAAAEINAAIDAGAGAPADLATDLITLLEKTIWELVKGEVESSFPVRKLWITVELLTAFGLGLGRLLLSGQPVRSLDTQELTAWLDANAVLGKLTKVTRESGPLRMVYELVFAFENGDSSRPNLAAGVAVVGLTRLVLRYVGNITYDMAAGMGETAIVPYYEAIRRRAPGTAFHFFHRVRELVPSSDGTRIDKVRIGVQATTNGSPYAPLKNVAGIRCFGEKPDYHQLAQGEALRGSDELPGGGFDLESSYTTWPDVATIELVAGRDFDALVLAIPAPALGQITAPLAAVSPRWEEMLANVTGVPTRAMELWMTETTEALGGWKARSGSDEAPLVGSYVDDLGTVDDMSHVIATERWPKDATPQSSVYFCGALPPPPDLPPGCDTPVPGLMARVREAATRYGVEWTKENVAYLFPGLVVNGAIDWDKLADPRGARGEARLLAQYFRGNVSASERYVTSFAGTITSRLRPDALTFANLLLAGDWTDNGMNAGALEAAVTSGRIAARKLLGAGYPLWGENETLL